MALSKSKHSFLTSILRAVQSENVGRSDCVFDKVLSLEFSLGEVFEQDSRASTVSEEVNELLSLNFFSLVLQFRVLTKPVRVVDKLHVSSIAKVLS